MYSFRHDYIFILLFQKLATNFGLNKIHSSLQITQLQLVSTIKKNKEFECDPMILTSYVI
jgi:hypothetical protein